MTVEVLGTVIGTAVQGQIVGMASAPCIPMPGDNVTVDGLNSSLLLGQEVNATITTVITLDQTVRAFPDALALHRYIYIYIYTVSYQI